MGAVTDLKSLSGGERSFTGVSFVLSLGREVRTPFFAMDEFDVFLDAVNRKVALKVRLPTYPLGLTQCAVCCVGPWCDAVCCVLCQTSAVPSPVSPSRP